MEEQEFLVNQTKQIAIKAVNQEEALKKVLNGEGTIAGMNMTCNPRPQQNVASGIQTSGQFSRTTSGQPPKLNG